MVAAQSKALSDKTWRKSSRSTAQGEDCVEVAGFTGMIAVRDSRDPEGPKVVLPRAAFRRLAHDIRSGQHDL
jgi:hypothetical protein